MSLAAKLAVVAITAAPLVLAAVTITGSVVDETGNPVPGARVMVDTIAAATSDAAGVYRVDIPAAGTYQLRVVREGFFLLINKDTRLDASAPIDIHLNHLKELAESINVPYSPPVVDPERTEEVKRLDGQAILNLPYAGSQDYRRALPLMSGAIQDNGGQVHFNGGETHETSYRLDGFDIANPASGGLSARMSVDTVQAVEWNSDRMPAEDKGSAGTVEIRTEMGDDRWRFGATNPIPSIETTSGLHVNHWSPRLMASGPIRKGKAWFHTALDPFYSANTLSSLPGGQNRTASFTVSDLNRFQWNVSDWQTLTGSVLYDRGNTWRYGLSFLNPAETTVNQRSSLMVAAIKDQFIVNGNLVEAGFASTRDYMRSSPLGSAAYLITPFGSSGNYFRDQTSRSRRQEVLVNVSFKPLKAGGTHQFRAGTDIENSDLDQTIARHNLSVVRADNSVVRTIEFTGMPRQAADNLEVYTYAVDHWIAGPTLTFDIGFRTHWNRVTGSAPPAPRLAASWAPKAVHGVKVSAGWGVYYDPITLALLALSEDQTSRTTLTGAAPMETRYIVNLDALKTPRFTVASISAEGALPHNFFGRVNVTSRQGSREFAFDQFRVSPVLNEYLADNSQHSSYRAAEFAVRRTFRAKYQWFAAYTRSIARTNTAIAYTIENPLLTPQAAGRQPWDAPNRLLMWGWAPVQQKWFPSFLRPIVGDTDLQLLADYRTGFAFNSTTETGYLAGAPGSRRYPDFLSVNLGIERRFHFHGYLWAWRASLINALGRSNPNFVNNDADSPQYLTFARGQARAVNFRVRFLGKK